jgi:hypothetical protein
LSIPFTFAGARMRVSRRFAILTAATVAAAGCASPFSASRKTADAPPQTDKSAATTRETNEKSATPEKKSSPFVAEREKKAAPRPSGDSSPAQTGSKSPDSSPAATDAPVSNAVLSSDLLKLIDEELWDASPDERAQWYAQLKRVDPAVIPDILRARRLSLRLASRPPGHLPASNPARPAVAPPQDAWPGAPPSNAIQPANYADFNATGSVTTAGFQSQLGDRPQVDQAIYQTDPRSAQPTVALQNFETEAGAPIAVQRQPLPADPRTSSFSEPSAQGVPWPPAAKPAAPSSARSNLAQPLQFGAGLVQNVVGLVPNRGTPAPNVPNANPVQPAVLTSSPSDWRGELTRVVSALEQEIAAQRVGGASDEDLRRQVSLRLLYLLADHQERALTAIPGLEAAEQEFWQQLVWGISNALDTRHITRAEDRATQTINQLNTAVRRLQERADLQIRNVAFCRQILYFGNYDRFPRDEFRPGQEVLLYAEIENFKSEPTADGQYRTLLRSSLEILSPSGEVRKQIDFPATEDLCRNYRRDYFHNYQFTIPDRLPLGPHVLKLSVFDELSGKMTTYSANFLVN